MASTNEKDVKVCSFTVALKLHTYAYIELQYATVTSNDQQTLFYCLCYVV